MGKLSDSEMQQRGSSAQPQLKRVQMDVFVADPVFHGSECGDSMSFSG